ncbi:hypothetical protein PIB30_097402, partial [Stylosanthes scabra]|nr:hypothetical protein [Stylosanthes scabra]
MSTATGPIGCAAINHAWLRLRRPPALPRHSCLYKNSFLTHLPISQSAPRITENTLRDPGIRKAPEMVTRADPDCEDRYCQFSPVHASPLAIRRNKVTLAKRRQCFVSGPTAPGGVVQINEIIMHRLNHASINHVWFVDSSDNCLELFLTVQGGYMSISAADLHRVQDLYRLDDNPGMGPYLLEVRYVDLGIFFIVVRNRLLDPVTTDPVEHLYFGELAPLALLGRVRDYFLIQYNDDASDGDNQENSDEYQSSDSSADDMEDEFQDFLVMPDTAIATYGKALSVADCTAEEYV